jgi:uncharacterized protein (DUF433 family)
MQLPEFLTEWPYGEIVLTGHRIGLYHVMSLYNRGFTAEKISERFPTLPLDLVQKVLAFYHQNKAEVDAYVARCAEDIERQCQAAKPFDLEELERRARERGMDLEALRRRIEASVPDEIL